MYKEMYKTACLLHELHAFQQLIDKLVITGYFSR